MGGDCSGVLGIKIVGEVVDESEAFDALGEHLVFDFVEDLVGLVFPVHKLQLFLLNVKRSNTSLSKICLKR